jgi:putative peptidoglycan lipid II flippase
MREADPDAAHESRYFSQAKLIAAWTALSRVMGLVRESLLAAVFGATWVLDSFYLAFQVPNLFRRLFGEGALSSAFIPVFTEEMERDRDSAWRLASACMTLLLGGLGLLTLVGEAALLLLWRSDPANPEHALFCQLAMVMLAFFPAICAVAILGGMLNVLRHFTVPALAPTALNVCMIAGAVIPVERYFEHEHARIIGLAVWVTVAGLIELWWMWAALNRCGGAVAMTTRAADLLHPGLVRVRDLFLPVVVGLGVLQFMEFTNSAAVRMLTAPAHAPEATMAPLGWETGVRYPLAEGSLSVLQCAQRIYQFPLGVFATALGTAVFPLFSLYAARGDRDGLSAAVAKAVRLSLFIGLPAGVGLILIGRPLSSLLFERGRFTSDDSARTAAVVVWYGAGMWAFCLHQIVTRAYYSLKDSRGPMAISIWLLPVNFALNVALIFVPGLGVAGVGLSSAVTFMATAVLMLRGLRGKLGTGLPTAELVRSATRTAAATAFMAAAGWATLSLLPAPTDMRWAGKLLSVSATVAVSMAVFFLSARLMRMPETGELLRRGRGAGA